MKLCRQCGTVHADDIDTCPFDHTALTLLEDPHLGTIIGGRYRIVEKIGEGGMGTVYRAQHVNIEKQVAVKMLPTRMATDAGLKKRFLREARAASITRHEHIIEIFDLDETEDGLPYMVMEFLDGMPLDEALRRGPLSLSRCIDMAMQIAQALGPAHAMGMVHRDLKPGNIFLVRKGSDKDFVKILDFGLVHLMHEPRLTEKGEVLGTPEYMSPEQAMGSEVGPQSDLYSLGCTLYEMVSGLPPFTGTRPVALMLAHVNETPKPLSSMVRGIPEELEQVVSKLLEKSPEDRYLDAYALLDDLKRIEVPVEKPARKSATKSKKKKERKARNAGTSIALESEIGTWRRYLHAAKLHGAEVDKNSYRAMETLATRLETLETQVEETSLMMEEVERQARETGRKIRFAIEELASEISRRRTELASRSSKLEDIDLGLLEEERNLASTLDKCWNPEMYHLGQRLEMVSARKLLVAGEIASRWIALDEARIQESRGSRSMAHEIDDLEYQISTLKTRIEENEKEAQKTIDKMRKKVEKLYNEKIDTIRNLSRHSTTLAGKVRLKPVS